MIKRNWWDPGARDYVGRTRLGVAVLAVGLSLLGIGFVTHDPAQSLALIFGVSLAIGGGVVVYQATREKHIATLMRKRDTPRN